MPENTILKTSVPSELVPHCPHCGKLLTMNLRSDGSFVEDAGWHAAAERYSEFLRRHEGQKILFLELGVGGNTPVIIKYPFWRMTTRNPNATYVCINKGEAVCPNEIAKQSLLLTVTLLQCWHRSNNYFFYSIAHFPSSRCSPAPR